MSNGKANLENKLQELVAEAAGALTEAQELDHFGVELEMLMEKEDLTDDEEDRLALLEEFQMEMQRAYDSATSLEGVLHDLAQT